MKSAVGMSARTLGWAVGAAAASAWLRELFHTGPRHSDDPPGGWDAFANASGGLVAGYAATTGLGLSPGRRGFFLVLCGAGGAALPAFLASAGPGVRSQLSKLALR